jgi:hypothetical protein
MAWKYRCKILPIFEFPNWKLCYVSRNFLKLIYGLLEGVLYHAILSYDIVWCDPPVIDCFSLVSNLYILDTRMSVAPPKFDVVARTGRNM